MQKTRVALADDHPIVLAGLGKLIEVEPDLELVGQGTSGQSALKMIRDKLPDVAIVDISMPEINGIALARRLAEECPSVRVLILTLYEERSFLKQALAAGVMGYVLKRSAAENLVRCNTQRKTWRTLCRSVTCRWSARRYCTSTQHSGADSGRPWFDGPRSECPQTFGARTDDQGDCRAARVER